MQSFICIEEVGLNRETQRLNKWLHRILSVSKFHFLHPETKDHHVMHELYVTSFCHRVNIPYSNIHWLFLDEIINRSSVQTI